MKYADDLTFRVENASGPVKNLLASLCNIQSTCFVMVVLLIAAKRGLSITTCSTGPPNMKRKSFYGRGRSSNHCRR